MFKTKRNIEENEDDMASRLQIEIGKFSYSVQVFLTVFLDRDRGNGNKRSQNLVDVFRGVSFDDWLQLTMEVINPLPEQRLTPYVNCGLVFVFAHSSRPTRSCGRSSAAYVVFERISEPTCPRHPQTSLDR
jgi:hypothetical protein